MPTMKPWSKRHRRLVQPSSNEDFFNTTTIGKHLGADLQRAASGASTMRPSWVKESEIQRIRTRVKELQRTHNKLKNGVEAKEDTVAAMEKTLHELDRKEIIARDSVVTTRPTYQAIQGLKAAVIDLQEDYDVECKYLQTMQYMLDRLGLQDIKAQRRIVQWQREVGARKRELRQLEMEHRVRLNEVLEIQNQSSELTFALKRETKLLDEMVSRGAKLVVDSIQIERKRNAATLEEAQVVAQAKLAQRLKASGGGSGLDGGGGGGAGGGKGKGFGGGDGTSPDQDDDADPPEPNFDDEWFKIDTRALQVHAAQKLASINLEAKLTEEKKAIAHYMQAYERIKKMTGVDDIGVFAERYVEQEQMILSQQKQTFDLAEQIDRGTLVAAC